MAIKLGEAKFGSKKQYFKVKDGSQTFRILPPMGDLADEGVWSKYYRINYGYVNADNKSRPFESSLVKNNKSKMVEVPDAAVERFDKLKASYETAHKAGDQKTKDALLPLVGGPKSRYNVDSNHYMNAIDLQGNIGILKLRHKCKQQLDIAIRELRDKGVNPLSVDNGRFFVFTRTGTRNETAFTVKVYQQTMNIEGVGEVNRDVVHKLDEAVINRLESEAGELNKLFKKPSAAQIAQIVKESDIKTGVSPNIDSILGFSKDEATGDAEAGSDEGEADPVAAALAEVKAAPAPKAEPKKAEKKAETAAPSTPTPTAVETTQAAAPAAIAPQTTSEKVADMSDSEFLASLGINN